MNPEFSPQPAPRRATPPASAPPPGVSVVEAERQAERAGALVMAARIALRRGQMDEARAKLKAAFELNSTDCGALELLGDIFLEEGEQEKAIRVFERGLQFYPRHTPFEEKIALAHIDLEEVRRDTERKQAMLEGGDRDKLLDRVPGRALGFSLAVPGAGQFYNGEEERAYRIGGVALGLFLAWAVPFALTLGALPEKDRRFSVVMSSWPSWGRTLFDLMIVCWLLTHVWAAIDAKRGAERANQGRRFGLGLEV